jgi:CRISPR-associated protein Csm1
MEPTTLKVALAGLLHDIGKFFDRDCLQLSWEDIDESEKQLYLPYRGGRYSHFHALYTALFFKFFRSDLPLELQQDEWGDGDSLVGMAAGHHKPSTPMQWVVAVADRVSSGWDRDTFNEQIQWATSWKDYKRTRMLPLFEQLALVPENERSENLIDARWYALQAVSPEAIFPLPASQSVPTSNEVAAAEYRELAVSFGEGLRALGHKENIELWTEHFDSLLMDHTTALPSARAGNVVPDVSLYDHSRATSALATAIYLYHAANGSLTVEAVCSYQDTKMLMIQGSFQGIQSYIFSRAGDSQRYRSKLLRGRSFSVTLMTEVAADMLCRRIGLPFLSVVLNAAGKFTLIAPNIPKTVDALNKVREEINDWLAEKTFGETRILLTSCPVTCNDLVSGQFTALWDRLGRQAEEAKFTGFDLAKYAGSVGGYLDSFHNQPGRPTICPVCGKRPALADSGAYLGEETAACALCRDHIFLGNNVVKWPRMVIQSAEKGRQRHENGLFEPLFGGYQVRFCDETDSEVNLGRNVLRCWQIASTEAPRAASRMTAKAINGYVPRYRQEDLALADFMGDDADGDEPPPVEGEPMTLNYLAASAVTIDPDGARGTEALGVLKADIDFLGALMACGLPEKRQTLSRSAALSRQVNWFFTIFLPHRLAVSDEYRKTYTVFAGGDDLFLIGPWNRMLGLAIELRQAFQKYVCGNPQIHLSAGISLHKSHTPISKIAEFSDAALESAKAAGRNRITVFDQTVSWDDFDDLMEIRRQMEDWLENDLMSRVFFYRINNFIAMAGRERRLHGATEVSMSDMACTKWRALLSYSAERNIAKRFKGEERLKMTRDITGKIALWLMRYGNDLRIPLWTILYNRR